MFLFYNDEFVGTISEANDENNPDQDPPMPLVQPSSTSQRARNNLVSEYLHMINYHFIRTDIYRWYKTDN